MIFTVKMDGVGSKPDLFSPNAEVETANPR